MTTLDPREIAFRHFWDRYPLKLAIAESRVAFANALKITDAATIIMGAQRFAQDPNRSPEYTPYPAKWLNGQRWLDGSLPPRTFSPQESAQVDKERAKVANERERAKSDQIAKEFAEAKARAVPLDPILKKSTLDLIQRNLYHEVQP